MKRLNYVELTFIILIFCLISSCQQKEEEPVDLIVGTWENVESSVDFSRTVTLSFYSDKTGLSTVKYVVFGNPESHNNNFTYTTKDGVLTWIFGTQFSETPYSISGDQLYLTYLEEDMVLTRKLP